MARRIRRNKFEMIFMEGWMIYKKRNELGLGLELELRNIHLMKRASAINIANKSSSEKIILNIQKIEHIIAIWRKIKYLVVTSARTNFKKNRHSNQYISAMERHKVDKKITFENHRRSYPNRSIDCRS